MKYKTFTRWPGSNPLWTRCFPGRQMLTIYLLCQEGGRWLGEPGERKQWNNDRTAEVYNQQGWYSDPSWFSDIRTPRLFYTLIKEYETYLSEAGTTDDLYNDHRKTATWKVQEGDTQSIRKTIRNGEGLVEEQGHAQQVPPTNWIRNMWM